MLNDRHDDHDDDGENREDEREVGRIVELDDLRKDVRPSEALEERTVEALRREGLIRAPAGARWRGTRAAGALAASAALFAVGLATGRLTVPAAGEPPGDTFALLLRAGDAPGAVDETTEARLVEEYTDWARSIAETGKLVDGEKLDDESRLLMMGERGIETESADVALEPRAVQGYFIIRAAGYDEAVRIARGCPHLSYGGSIEIRRIDLH